MARKLNTDDDIDAFIDAFIDKVIDEARHHAGAVQNVIQPLSDTVRERIDISHDTVEVYERNGNLARTCWVTIEGRRYVFSYNYGEGRIDLRDRSTRGKLRHHFDNESSQDEIASVVAEL